MRWPEGQAVEYSLELAKLTDNLRIAEGTIVAFAAVDDYPTRNALIGELRLRLAGEMEVREVHLTPDQPDLLDAIQATPGSEGDRIVYFIYGFEELSGEARRRAMAGLNIRRELLRRLRCPLILWLTGANLADLARTAPDFYAWRTTIYDFSAAQLPGGERISPIRQMLDVYSPSLIPPEEMRKRTRLYKARLDELEAEGKSRPETRAWFQHQLGMIHSQLGEWDEALDYYRRSLEIKERLGDQAGAARTLNNIGLTYANRGEWDEALDYYRRSLEIKERLGDQAGVAQALNNIGAVYQRKGEWDQALDYYRRNLEIKERLGDQTYTTGTRNNVGLIYANGEPSLQAQLSELRDQLAKLEALRGLLGDQLTDQKRAELEGQIRALVETGGGAVVLGDVTVEGGDFVGRDKWQVILGDQYVGLSPDQVPSKTLLRAYLRHLAQECRRLPLGVVDPRFLQTGPATPVTLSEVYVDLDVVAPPREAREKGEMALLGRLARGDGGERTPLLEAMAHPEAACVVLLGDPGSGKTTFVNYLTHALALAEEGNGRSPLLPDDSPLQGMPPVRLVLREVAARCIPPGATRGEARMLWDALHADLAARLGQAAADTLFPHLQGQLLEQGGLILLDGLDEVPEAERRRRCLLEAVADLADALPPERSRVLVTARPYAYADPRWHLTGFQTLVLAPFNEGQVARFVERWYRAVGPVMGWDEATARGRGERLRAALAGQPYLSDLAARPLLLTLMTTLHTSWGKLPEDRADLYEETVKLLLSRWQRAREVKDADGETVTEPGIAQVLAVDEVRVRAALHWLACDVHERQGQQAGRTAAPADIREGEVLAAFAPLLPPDFNPAVLLRYLETRAGLLVGRAPGVYAFPHRSFQEYLAACHLADGTEFAAALRERVWEDPAWWREVFLLGVGKARQGGLGNAMHVVNTLLPQGPEEVAGRSETHWQAAVLAAQALLDLRFPEQAAGQVPLEATLGRARRWLAALLESPDALAPRERAEAGDLLGRLGDPRPGVGVDPGTGVPDILWVEAPAGPFLMGSAGDDEMAYDDERPQHTLKLPAFLVSRYPITNTQYRPFVEGGGYDEPHYWTEEGWVWRTGELEPDLSLIDDEDLRRDYANWLAQRPVAKRDRPFWWDDPRWGLPNRPVVGVSWYEALAYCRWLEEQLRIANSELRVWRDRQVEPLVFRCSSVVIRLPSEAEWEKAARGPAGRHWPWGDEWIEGRANTEEAEIGETSAVGAFPAGASPCGALDVAGNVWEWTCSRWGRTSLSRPDYGYPYNPADGREDPGGPDWRVVRGGSWFNVQRNARCAYRHWSAPGDWDDGMGFRVVVSLALPSSDS